MDEDEVKLVDSGKIPKYTLKCNFDKNMIETFRFDSYYILPMCPYMQGVSIGSAWCSRSCKFIVKCDRNGDGDTVEVECGFVKNAIEVLLKKKIIYEHKKRNR